ncbi:Rpn family recombination-promoting nuclease/putative transposase [Lachnospiraceae bacterium ASD4241]|uniref:Rpn family recombination-promoting nuclease/putative transposase n=1 Tax=Diplocloster modestus TaxID=2850322 RepID=A0ABS6KDJ7_9FIRM|nr:Rpn family recombination-promoting nuclease/putative transposase [Diplocloster modestus]
MKGLLGALLEIPPEQIVDLEVIDSHLEQEYVEDKEGILDLRLRCAHEKQINIEMQLYHVRYWVDRSMYYNCKMLVISVKKGELYRTMKHCVHIGILDFDLFPEQREFYSIHKITNMRNGKIYSDKLAFHVIELRKLEQATDEEKKEEVYRWAKLISARSIQEMRAVAQGDEYMNEMVDTFEDFDLDDEERYRAFRREMAIMDHKSGLDGAYEEGMETGMETGLQIMISTLQEMGLSKEEVRDKVKNSLTWTDEKTEEIIEKYWQSS